MKRKSAYLGGLMLAALGTLAGCSQATPNGGTTPATTRVVVASSEQSGITVTGRGEAKAAPDVAYFEIGVDLDAPSVAQARSAAAKAADSVITSLKKNGVEPRDIQTSSLSVAPRYEYSGGKDRITGYGVSARLTVKARDLDRVGKLIDDATLAGGNATRVEGIRFDFDDPAKLRDAAREQAVGDARRKAGELARLAGVSLAGPVLVEEIQTSASLPPTVTLEASGSDLARTPIERGTGSLAVEVRVRWAIKG